MSKYAIKNPTLRKVRNRGYRPVKVWLDGWYNGWQVKEGRVFDHVYLVSTGRVHRLPKTKRIVRDI